MMGQPVITEHPEPAMRTSQRSRRLSPEQIRHGVALVRGGYPVREAAAVIGCTERGLRFVLNRHGKRDLPLPKPAPDPDERLRRARLMLRARRLESGHRLYAPQLPDGRRADVHVLLSPAAARQLHAEAERRGQSMSSLVAKTLFDAGVIGEV